MIENLPNWINVVFTLITLVTIGLFYVSNGKPKKVALIIVVWCIIQSVLAYSGFYQVTSAIPPRFGLVLIPPAVFIVFAISPKNLKWVLNNRKTEISTFLHSIRFPVEIVLLHLFLNKMIPEIMTYEGYNFDILVGITAPIVGWLYLKKIISKNGLIIWNVLGLTLIVTILTIAILSSELPFQCFGFNQPNRGVSFFPFVLLPATVVPIVIFTHITDIIKLRCEIKGKR